MAAHARRRTNRDPARRGRGDRLRRFDRIPGVSGLAALLRGGDRSIRGYGYREVGPRFEGETLGGLHRIVASAEYQYFFTEEWGAAVFVDAGDAFNTRSAFDPKVGVGVGARWRSPVGLVGVDVARGLDEAAGGGTRLHLSFGVGF